MAWDVKKVSKSAIKAIRAFITHDCQCQGLPIPTDNKHLYPDFMEIVSVIQKSEAYKSSSPESAETFREVRLRFFVVFCLFDGNAFVCLAMYNSFIINYFYFVSDTLLHRMQSLQFWVWMPIMIARFYVEKQFLSSVCLVFFGLLMRTPCDLSTCKVHWQKEWTGYMIKNIFDFIF